MRRRYEIGLDDSDPGQAQMIELLNNLGNMKSGFMKSLLRAYIDRYGTTLPGMSELFSGEGTVAVPQHSKVKRAETPAPRQKQPEKQEPQPEAKPQAEPQPQQPPKETAPAQETRQPQPETKTMPAGQPKPAAEAPKPEAEVETEASPQAVDKAFLQNALSGIM
jgi:hypothetical protein